jgi:hypothetical protein
MPKGEFSFIGGTSGTSLASHAGSEAFYMNVVRGERIEEMSNDDLGALYVQLSREQLGVGSAEVARALDAELILVVDELASRGRFF